ncbi:MAG: hypothetical protein AAFX52_07185 [Pseudomonadota bacterium]
MRTSISAFMALGLVLTACDGTQEFGLPSCDSAAESPEVLKLVGLREAMNVVPLSSQERSVTWKTLCLRLSAVEPVAFETGEWSEAIGDASFAAGSYAAVWRKTGGVWELEDDLKTLEGCGGDLCP